ncbi:hypothetical protein [Streptococcus sanguinis]|uniref:hypothetical protein n=1 Tax=Streptococcus sanguinis TaxID=1305 RepID=UPI000B0EA5B1|nr:hypothetical protein [Streptococcus sanguinis]
MKKTKCRHQLFDYEADYVICTACLFLPLIFPPYRSLGSSDWNFGDLNPARLSQ